MQRALSIVEGELKWRSRELDAHLETLANASPPLEHLFEALARADKKTGARFVPFFSSAASSMHVGGRILHYRGNVAKVSLMRLAAAAAGGVGLLISACFATPPLVECPQVNVDRPAPESVPLQNLEANGFRKVVCDDLEYGMVSSGSRTLSMVEHRAWITRALPEVQKLDGAWMSFTGACCSSQGRPFSNEGCLMVFLDQGSKAQEKLAEVLRRTLADSEWKDAEVRVTVSQSSPRRPRCPPTDPDCGPLPYEGGKCVSLSATRSWGRYPMDRYPAGDACTYDGECTTANSECNNFRATSRLMTMEYNGNLKNAYCGCLERQCRWFRMR